jgi:hypothetical protein
MRTLIFSSWCIFVDDVDLGFLHLLFSHLFHGRQLHFVTFLFYKMYMCGQSKIRAVVNFNASSISSFHQSSKIMRFLSDRNSIVTVIINHHSSDHQSEVSICAVTVRATDNKQKERIVVSVILRWNLRVQHQAAVVVTYFLSGLWQSYAACRPPGPLSCQITQKKTTTLKLSH